uniref:Uncharacterized protein n=1 Tax=Sphaerodactylus townsendi TaxID=933632 RepID=A0ACB8FNC7_9SAUR
MGPILDHTSTLFMVQIPSLAFIEGLLQLKGTEEHLLQPSIELCSHEDESSGAALHCITVASIRSLAG